MFTVLKGGCFSRHSSDFFMNRPNGLPYHVLLLIKTNAEITLDGVTHHCTPDSALLIRPGTSYSYKNPAGDYMDDWIHFTCDKQDLALFSEELFQQSFPVNNVRLLTTYIQQMLWENTFMPENEKDFYVDSLFRILLQHITGDFYNRKVEEYNPYRYKLQKVRLELAAAPYKKYTAAEFAERLTISTSYFQALYKSMFDIAFQADIINMRVEYAKELITGTDFPLEQIAYSCGYSSEVHFYRQFQQRTGMTPGDYRRFINISETM